MAEATETASEDGVRGHPRSALEVHVMLQSVVLSLILLGTPHSASAARRNDRPIQAPPSAEVRLRDGNTRFATGYADHPNQSIERREELAKGQKPWAIVLTCADSRLPPEILFDTGLGDLFVIRVAGNVAGTNELASAEYAAQVLGATYLLVLGHSNCGAVSAACSPKLPDGNIGKLIALIEPSVTATRHAHPKLGKDELVVASTSANVLMQVSACRAKSPVLKHLEDAGKLTVAGAIYDVASGRVKWISAMMPTIPMTPQTKSGGGN